MTKIVSTVVLAAVALTLASAQVAPPQNSSQNSQTPQTPQKKTRDLNIDPDNPKPADVPKSLAGPHAIPRSYAVVIGVSEYPNLPEKYQLHYANRDAESIYSILISPEGGNYRAENVHKLIGTAATLENIQNELEEWLPSVADPEDLVLVYFAGHGFVVNGATYLAPSDFRMNEAVKTGYSAARLGTLIGSKIQARYKVLLTDACHSGAIMPDQDAESLNKSLGTLSQSIFSLTASRDRERSLESSELGGGHGLFTYYVIKGMEGAADESRDGVVTADELAEYVRRNVREVSHGTQNPTSDRGSFDPNMMLAYVPKNAVRGETVMSKSGTLVIEANMDAVEVLVDGKSAGTASRTTPLILPGLMPGPHTVQGVHLGYEPDGPREEMVYPGQEKTVTLRILIQRRRTKAAVDHLNQGLGFYKRGTAAEYQKAAAEFEAALSIDPKYSEAAMYLGRTRNALFQQKEAAAAFQRAIAADPDYLEAHVSFSGALLDMGRSDEAVQHLNLVVSRDPKNENAWYLLSRAYDLKGSYEQAVDASRTAIKLAPKNAEAHFMLAEALRKSLKWNAARAEYESYLSLSAFDSKLAGQLSYYVLGSLIGMGKRSQASQKDIWKDLQILSYFGICDCDQRMGQFDRALENCNQALKLDSQDAMTHYATGLTYAKRAERTGSMADLSAAKQHFQTMLAINPDLEQAPAVRKMLANIDSQFGVSKTPKP